MFCIGHLLVVMEAMAGDNFLVRDENHFYLP